MKSSCFTLLFMAIMFPLLSALPKEVYGQGEKWYAVTQKTNKKGVAFINSRGKTMLKMDTSFVLEGEIGKPWLEDDFFILYKSLNNKEISYAINRKGELVHQFPERYHIKGKISPIHFMLYDRIEDGYQLMDAKTLQPLNAYYQDIAYDNGIYAVIRKDGFMAFLDSNGQEYLKTEIMREDKYSSINKFAEGLLFVGKKVINTKGETVFSIGNNNYVRGFSDGLAVAQDNQYRLGMMDTKGNWVVKPQHQLIDLYPYQCGLICARDSASRQYGYINDKAEWVIPPIYLQAESFEYGKAQVDLWNESLGEKKITYNPHQLEDNQANTRYGIPHRQIINTKGKVLYEDFFRVAVFPDEEITVITLGNSSTHHILLNDEYKIIYEDFNEDYVIRDLYTIERLFNKSKTKVNAKGIELYYSYTKFDFDLALKTLEKANPFILTFRFWNKELFNGQGGEFPLVITQMDNLEYLNLSNNQIASIPEEIIHLQNLKELNLSNNLLEKLPEAVFKLKSLQKLDISYNKLPPKEMVRIREGLPHVKIIFN